MMKTIPAYSKQVTMKSLDYLEIDILLKKTSQKIALEKLFDIAIRKNKKRIFLFVSKVLGKHLAIDPKIPSLAGILLAYQFKGLDLTVPIKLLESEKIDDTIYKQLREKKVQIDRKTLLIGFAETATGLGHSMFSSLEGDVSYIHTTRESIISETPSFTFEEVHSHATGHQCFSEQKDYFNRFEDIVLVDDEITTGHTALHLIEALYAQSKNKHFYVVSLLDWRSQSQIKEAEALAEKLGISITFVSLIQGEMHASLLKKIPEQLLSIPELIEEVPDHSCSYQTLLLYIDKLTAKLTKAGDGRERKLFYMKANGRFGLSSEENTCYEKKIEELGNKLKAHRQYEKTLVIGTEEFIYIPCLLAQQMGEGVKYQSSTRSPIIANHAKTYPIQTVLAYHRPEDETVTNYLYNIIGDNIDEVFWIMERDVEEGFKAKMAHAFNRCGIKRVNFVACDKREG